MSLPERMLGRGSARVTFAVGVILSFPGVSYLTALDRMAKLDAGTVAPVLLVVGFCLMQLMLLELPLMGYAFAPDWTQDAVTGSAPGSVATAAARGWWRRRLAACG